MIPVKRLEIVVSTAELSLVINLLKKNGVNGYTIIKNVQGNGDRGEQDGEGLTTVFQNSYILVACSEAEAQVLTEPIRSLLKKIGGICLISDAQWIQH